MLAMTSAFGSDQALRFVGYAGVGALAVYGTMLALREHSKSSGHVARWDGWIPLLGVHIVIDTVRCAGAVPGRCSHVRLPPERAPSLMTLDWKLAVHYYLGAALSRFPTTCDAGGIPAVGSLVH